jgi:tetratricopeptide (TPR) repeat protein
MAGRVADGLLLLEKALKQALLIRMLQGHPWLLVRLAEAYLLAGRPIDANASAMRALTLAREGAAQGAEAAALRLIGVIAAHHDPPDTSTSEAFHRQALTLADELSMGPLVAHCHLGLGKLYRRTDDHAKAQEHLRTARAMYREMDMGFWLEKADAELGGVER